MGWKRSAAVVLVHRRSAQYAFFPSRSLRSAKLSVAALAPVALLPPLAPLAPSVSLHSVLLSFPSLRPASFPFVPLCFVAPTCAPCRSAAPRATHKLVVIHVDPPLTIRVDPSKRLGIMLHRHTRHQEPIECDPPLCRLARVRRRGIPFLQLADHLGREGEAETEQSLV